MQQPSSDDLKRASRGDAAAFEGLIRAYHRPIYHYLYRLVGNAADAEDLSQETFLRMAKGLPGFAGDSAFTTWLFQIAKNLGVDLLRRRELESAPKTVVPLRLHAARPPLVVEGFEEAELLWACIRELNADLRSALVLRDLVGFTYREIAEILDTTVATVKWRIYEARERVQASYREGSESSGLPESLGGRLLPPAQLGRRGETGGRL